MEDLCLIMARASSGFRWNCRRFVMPFAWAACGRMGLILTGPSLIFPKNKFLDIELLIHLLTNGIGRQISTLEFCGNIDEPLAHPRFTELLQRVHDLRPEMRIIVHTNGGWADAEKVRAVARTVAQFKNYSILRFSLDGLEDTNHIYRQGISWRHVERNVKICVEEKARVVWQYLVFPWNRHQVEDAKALATQWGCSEFWVRPDRSLVTALGIETIKERKARNERFEGRPGGLGLDEAQLRDKEISCSFKRDGMVFVSWQGKVWPCCFISNIFYKGEEEVRRFEALMLERYPENFNSLYHHSFDDIMASPLFKNDLMESWSKPNPLKWRCAEMCSVDRKRTSDSKPDDRTFYEQVQLRA